MEIVGVDSACSFLSDERRKLNPAVQVEQQLIGGASHGSVFRFDALSQRI